MENCYIQTQVGEVRGVRYWDGRAELPGDFPEAPSRLDPRSIEHRRRLSDEEHALTQALMRRLDDLMQGNVGRVAEFGCGTGRLACAIAARGHHTLGIDFATNMRIRAQSRAIADGVADILQIVAGDERTLLEREGGPLQSDSLHVFLAARSLIHVIDQESWRMVLLKGLTALREGGFLIVHEPMLERNTTRYGKLFRRSRSARTLGCKPNGHTRIRRFEDYATVVSPFCGDPIVVDYTPYFIGMEVDGEKLDEWYSLLVWQLREPYSYPG